MRKSKRRAARRNSARSWIASGGTASVRTYARRYGVDRYTAHEDLLAIGFPVAPGDARWAVRPPAIPKKRRPVGPADRDVDWICDGHRCMFVVGYTPGGAPYGYTEDSCALATVGEPVCPGRR